MVVVAIILSLEASEEELSSVATAKVLVVG